MSPESKGFKEVLRLSGIVRKIDGSRVKVNENIYPGVKITFDSGEEFFPKPLMPDQTARLLERPAELLIEETPYRGLCTGGAEIEKRYTLTPLHRHAGTIPIRAVFSY